MEWGDFDTRMVATARQIAQCRFVLFANSGGVFSMRKYYFLVLIFVITIAAAYFVGPTVTEKKPEYQRIANPISCMAIGGMDRQKAIGDTVGVIHLFSASKDPKEITVGTGQVKTLVFSENGSQLFFAVDNKLGAINLFDLTVNEVILEEKKVLSNLASSGDRAFLTASEVNDNNCILFVIDINKRQVLARKKLNGRVNKLLVNPDPPILVTRGQQIPVRLLDLNSLECVGEIEESTLGAPLVALSNEPGCIFYSTWVLGQELLSTGYSPDVVFEYDLSRQRIKNLPGYKLKSALFFTCIDVSSVSHDIAVGLSREGRGGLAILDLAGRIILHRDLSFPVTCVCFFRTERLVLVGGARNNQGYFAEIPY